MDKRMGRATLTFMSSRSPRPVVFRVRADLDPHLRRSRIDAFAFCQSEPGSSSTRPRIGWWDWIMTAHINEDFKYLRVATIAAATPKRTRKMKSVIKKHVFVSAQVWPRALESNRSWIGRRSSNEDFLAIAGSYRGVENPQTKIGAK